MLTIKLQPSWLLTAILVAAHGAAVGLVLIVDMPSWLKLTISTALILNCVLCVGQAALLLMPFSTVAIEVSSDNLLSVQTRSKDWIKCEVLGSTYVASFLTVLNLRQIGQMTTKHIVILPDSIETEDFRRLRVWLRWQQRPQHERA